MRIDSVVTVVSLAVASFAAVSPARAQVIARASVDSAGAEADSWSESPAISADGRVVAFEGIATDLVPGDRNDVSDVFVHDLSTGETVRVSVDSFGAEGDAPSRWPSISADGRFVSFASEATNLVPGDVNGVWDVFVHDRLTGATARESVDSAGGGGNSVSLYASLSADGRFVAFQSYASNLVPGDTNSMADIFVRDRAAGVTERVSLSSLGIQANGWCWDPSISGDGRMVAFASQASTLIPSYPEYIQDCIYVRDRQTGETSRVSVDSRGWRGNWNSSSPSISADGRFVAFASLSTDLVPGDTNREQDVFVHDRSTGATTRASVDSAGVEGNGRSDTPSISSDGRYVAFASFSIGLVPGDENSVQDVFVRDLSTGATSLASVDAIGVQGNRSSDSPSVSADGRYLAFRSGASRLVPGDTNLMNDIFVRNRVDCRAGNVNVGAGAVADVLFVNDSTGGAARTVRLLASDPLAIVLGAPPSATRPAPFALYAWASPPAARIVPYVLPFGIGETCLPTPLGGGSPAPKVVWNNTGSALLGSPARPSSPAPSIVLQRPRAFRRPAVVYLQGIIRDLGAPNGRAAVTNGVTIEIR